MHQRPLVSPLTKMDSLWPAVAALVWIGAELTAIMEGIVPILAAVGAIIVLIGLTVDAGHYKRSLLATAKHNWKARQKIDQPGQSA